MFGDKDSKNIFLYDKISFVIIMIGFFTTIVLLQLIMSNKREVYIGNNEIYYKLISLDIKLDETNKILKELQKNNRL